MPRSDHALALAERGVPVFPCGSDKRPLVARGFKDASTDADITRAWWERWSGALVGVPTGERSGIFVLDIDSAKHLEADEWLERHAQRLPDTRMHRTRSGGLHLLFQHRAGLKNTASLLSPGVDTRGNGGYVIWWPSEGLKVLHGSVLAEVPGWVLDALVAPAKDLPEPSPTTRLGHEQSQRKLDGIIRTIASAPEGERNHLTFWGACRLAEMAEQNALDRGAAIAIAVEAASRAGLPRQEALRTAQSAFRGRG